MASPYQPDHANRPSFAQLMHEIIDCREIASTFQNVDGAAEMHLIPSSTVVRMASQQVEDVLMRDLFVLSVLCIMAFRIVI